jgi:hypothetical protein
MINFRLALTCQSLFALFVATLLAPEVAKAQSVVPFKATIAISESIQPIGSGPCFLVGDISGTGVATHLGKLTLVSRDCINPISETAFSFFSNQLVLTVANGDQIFAAYCGTFTIEGTVGVITGGYQITGGTGRYAEATGAGTVQGTEDLNTGKGAIQLVGTISY